MVNGTNSVILSGRYHRQHPHPPTRSDSGICSFNLVRAIRARRLQWLGHILRLDEERILQRAVKEVYENKSEGNIMMDAPKTDSWREMKIWEADRDKWRARVQSLRWGSGVHIQTKVFVPEWVVPFTVST